MLAHQTSVYDNDPKKTFDRSEGSLFMSLKFHKVGSYECFFYHFISCTYHPMYPVIII